MTMIEFEKVLRMHHPDWVVVVGDVNATCACSITAKKEGIKVAHIEAGLRSHDNSMPEEINRLVTDRLSDLLFTPDRMSSDNLYKEGANPKTVRFVGNIMIDTLEAQKQKAMMLTIDDIIGSNLFPGRNLPLPKIKQFGVITLHRPSNVDNHDAMNAIINFFVNEAALELPLLWPIHPRTLKQMQIDGTFDKVTSCQNIILLQPLGYHELLKFNIEAIVVMSDSGGLQEECCVLGTPCLIMRKNTERPVTLRENGGVGVLVGNDIDLLRSEFQSVMKNITRKFFRPELWDGNTATRIVQELVAAK
jgi:UDP-N-acetylglucosamine 2-epimerase (non-hydrolysing)